MSPIAREKEQPRRAKSLVFSMMMIMSAFSAGIPLASAAGQNGEWIQVDMTQTHWDAGDTVETTISGGSLDSIPGYTVEWKLEDMNMNQVEYGTETISAPASGDTFEYSLSFNNLNEDCFNLIGDLFDNGGAFVDGSSMSFDVGAGMCQGGPSGPHIWWNGSYWFDTDESVVFFAEAEGLDEAEDYTLQWEVLDDQSNQVGNGSEDLSMVGQNTSIEILVGQLGDACYEIKGMLLDAESKVIAGSDANYMFEVGNENCQTGPPSMIDVYIHYYDGALEISSYGYEADQSSLNIQVSIFDAAGIEFYGLDVDFTADEYGMFEYADTSQTFEDGEYAMEVLVTNLTDDSILFEGSNMTLYVYNDGGGNDGPTIYAWLENQYSSGDEIIVGYYIDSGEGSTRPTFVCGNGDEIDFSWVNDGEEDCEDGSDEPQDMDPNVDSDGDENFTNDHDSWFDCNDANGSTVNMDVVNDGNWDCENGADEGEAAGPPEDEGDGPDLSATLNLYDDMDSTLLSTHHLDMNHSNTSLGMLDDGDYKVEVILEETDAAGDTWEVDSHGFNFCLGEDCEGGGPPVMMTGNATLDLSVTFDDYDSANCMGGFVMLFDYDEIYMDMMSNDDGGDHGDDDGGDDGPGPVWFDWQTVTSPGDFTMTELPEGDWVVIVSIGCQDPDTGDDYSAMNINGPWSLYNTTFTNGSTTFLSVDLQIMDDDEGDGGIFGAATGNIGAHLMVEETTEDGILLTFKIEMQFSDFLRAGADDEFGNGDGIVNEEEATSFMEFMELMMSMGDEGDDGLEHFAWNGVALMEEDILSEEMIFQGLVGTAPMSEEEDTASVYMVMRTTFLLIDNGEDVQVLSASEYDDDGDDGGDGEESCEFMTVYAHDSETWNIESITDGPSHLYTYDEDDSSWSFAYGCNEEPTDAMSVSFSRVIEEPEPTVNTPPTCDVFWFGSDDNLANGTSGGHKAVEGTETGDFNIELTEDKKYTLMFYCMDAEDDEITVTVDPSIGDTKTMTGNGILSGYYEFTIPTGISALGEMSFDYDWTDGTNTGDGTVSVKVLKGSDDGGDDDTATDDVSAGSFVPGFTAVLTMTALAGAFLVFSRREEE